eukprot:1141639-Pelagomonas_calceolata.AAC.6
MVKQTGLCRRLRSQHLSQGPLPGASTCTSYPTLSKVKPSCISTVNTVAISCFEPGFLSNRTDERTLLGQSWRQDSELKRCTVSINFHFEGSQQMTELLGPMCRADSLAMPWA